MKLIRELRIGPPKSFKTGAVVGTYPKPMLVFLFDSNGLTIIPSKKEPPMKGYIDIDIISDDLKEITFNDLITYCKMPQDKLPKVTYIDFNKLNKSGMTFEASPFPTDDAYRTFVDAVNFLVSIGCPWATYVFDSTTSFFDCMKSSMAKNQAKTLEDARKWSPAIGGKVCQHIGVLNKLKCHCVYLAHSHMEKNEISGDISVLPLGPASFAEQAPGLVDNYIYQTMETGEAQVWTRPSGNVKAIGMRWPSRLPGKVGADFKSIYGKELGV